MSQVKTGFLIGIGVFLALLVLGFAQGAIGKVASRG